MVQNKRFFMNLCILWCLETFSRVAISIECQYSGCYRPIKMVAIVHKAAYKLPNCDWSSQRRKEKWMMSTNFRCSDEQSRRSRKVNLSDVWLRRLLSGSKVCNWLAECIIGPYDFIICKDWLQIVKYLIAVRLLSKNYRAIFGKSLILLVGMLKSFKKDLRDKFGQAQ